MNDDMSAMLQNMSKMMNGNQEIPDNIKNILNTMTNNNSTTDNPQDFSSSNNDDSRTNSSTTNNPFENFDMNTFIKMQQILSSMNNSQNDSRTNLLLSLKPYLKESRKNKVDQYIQLLKIEKVFEIMNPLGGDNQHVQ